MYSVHELNYSIKGNKNMQVKSVLGDFKWSIFFTIIGFLTAGWWGYNHGISVGQALYIVFILSVIEISLSFDNAVVNATKLQEMSVFWQKLFLYFGIWVAVFGMRFYFPIEIVAVTTGKGFMEILNLSLNDPKEYSRLLTSHHAEIAFFGGAFLFMVFFEFLFSSKDHYWLGKIEEKFGLLEEEKKFPLFVTSLVVIGFAFLIPEEKRYLCVFAGFLGVILHVAVSILGDVFERRENGHVSSAGKVLKTGVAGFSAFLYLEVLDASFSFDGVMGAFVITNDVVLIMIGLAIGAFWVRSATMVIVKTNALNVFKYLEHGAHYAIGALALIMFVSTLYHVPEWIPGGVGVAFIALSIYSSVREKKKEQI